MLKGELNKLVNQRLLDALRPHGFRRKQMGVFKRDFAGGFDTVVVLSNNRQPPFHLGLSFDIRLDSVEQQLQRLRPKSLQTDESLLTESVTTITHMGNIRKGGSGSLYYVISTERELEQAMNDCTLYLASSGLHHFEKLHSEEALDRAFNDYPMANCVHCTQEVRRVPRGLVLASLTHRETIDDLVGVYQAEYVERWKHASRSRPQDAVLVRYIELVENVIEWLHEAR